MSYDISLRSPDTGETIVLDETHNIAGGTYALGGTSECWLNITWNYGKHFRRVLGEGGIRSIYGMTGEASLPVLRAGADALGNDVSADYWEATEGNAKRSILGLIALAELAPHGIWEGD